MMAHRNAEDEKREIIRSTCSVEERRGLFGAIETSSTDPYPSQIFIS